MDKVKNQLSSIRVSLIVCIAIALLVAQGGYLLSLRAIDNAMLDLMDPRPDSFVFDSGKFVTLVFGDVSDREETRITDESRFEIYRKLRVASPFIINGVSIIVAIAVYYRVKLQRSLTLLDSGIRKISAKELDFSIKSPSSDELGRLCGAFEDMRAELARTFHALWQSEENQRNLYRAFAHDLRTPLTVIKGNNEIIELVAAKNKDWDKALGAVALSNSAVERIEQYAEQLRELEGMDDWRPELTDCDLHQLSETIRQQAKILGQQLGKQVDVETDAEGMATLDWSATLRIADNIILNALQHASQQISIRLIYREGQLELAVSDDGPGFSREALKKAATPFWSTDKSGGHMGLGLTIASSLTEKCGGSLAFENNSGPGATVKISFPKV